MTLRLYNTLTKAKDAFAPLDAKNVRMYVCGPTVYDFAHIGNARPVIVFDVLFRLLRHLYGDAHVTYVRNITDVDDKINARAAEANISIRELTEQTARQYREDVAALGCLPPTHEPRATEHIAQMIAMIERLIAAGHAYEAQGHVLYDVSSKQDYGKLARRSLEEMLAGARVEVAPYKKNPMDFVLWKPSDAALPGWDSPWGRGRPGWHIECSAMSETLLGETFDIHGGGVDLVFPHHENEIAQSEGAHGGHPLAKVWMHNGFLQVEGEKMSKSLGNFVTIRQLMRGWSGNSWSGPAIKLAMMQTHYRQPINWTVENLSKSKEELGYWAWAISALRRHSKFDLNGSPSDELLDVLKDDLNTPAAIAVIRRNAKLATDSNVEAGQKLFSDLQLLGLLNARFIELYFGGARSHALSKSTFLEALPFADALKASIINEDTEYQSDIERALSQMNVRRMQRLDGRFFFEAINPESESSGDDVQSAIDARNAARKAKNFKESDRIRDELLAKGIVLKDGPTGTTWEVKR